MPPSHVLGSASKLLKAKPTKSVRMDAETLRLVKVAAAAAGESMQAWLEGACRARLEREGKHGVGGGMRVATVRFADTTAAKE